VRLSPWKSPIRSLKRSSACALVLLTGALAFPGWSAPAAEPAPIGQGLSSSGSHLQWDDPLEAVLLEYNVKSVDDFLAREEVVKAYFKTAQQFFGADRFPKASYDAVIAQLHKVAALPGSEQFKEQLFATSDLGRPYSVQLAFKPTGRDLDRRVWQSKVKNWTQSLAHEAGAINSPEKARAAAMNLRNEQARFRKEISRSDLTEAEVDRLKKSYFAAQKESPELKSLAAYLLKDSFERGALVPLAKADDADFVLGTLSELKNSPLKLVNASGELPDGVAAAVRDIVPKLSDFSKDEKTFPRQIVTTAKGKANVVGTLAADRVDFLPLSRRFHGIFKGIPLNECVGGACEYLDKLLTPERWAGSALSGTQIHWIRVGDHYSGFVNVAPVKYTPDGKTYGSVDFGSKEFSRTIYVRDPATGAAEGRTLYNVWLHGVRQNYPKKWAGIVKGKQGDFHNAGVLPTVYDSPELVLSHDLGTSADYVQIDPVSKFISAASKQVIYPEFLDNNYPKGLMWLDVHARNSSEDDPEHYDDYQYRKNPVVRLNTELDPMLSSRPLDYANRMTQSSAKIDEHLNYPNQWGGRAKEPPPITTSYAESRISLIEELARKPNGKELSLSVMQSLTARISNSHVSTSGQTPYWIEDDKFMQFLDHYGKDFPQGAHASQFLLENYSVLPQDEILKRLPPEFKDWTLEQKLEFFKQKVKVRNATENRFLRGLAREIEGSITKIPDFLEFAKALGSVNFQPNPFGTSVLSDVVSHFIEKTPRKEILDHFMEIYDTINEPGLILDASVFSKEFLKRAATPEEYLQDMAKFPEVPRSPAFSDQDRAMMGSWESVYGKIRDEGEKQKFLEALMKLPAPRSQVKISELLRGKETPLQIQVDYETWLRAKGAKNPIYGSSALSVYSGTFTDPKDEFSYLAPAGALMSDGERGQFVGTLLARAKNEEQLLELLKSPLFTRENIQEAANSRRKMNTPEAVRNVALLDEYLKKTCIEGRLEDLK
jgi:hypothetical protein